MCHKVVLVKEDSNYSSFPLPLPFNPTALMRFSGRVYTETDTPKNIYLLIPMLQGPWEINTPGGIECQKPCVSPGTWKSEYTTSSFIGTARFISLATGFS